MNASITPEENLRIQAAVAEAEASTSGEIVACLMAQSDAYEAGYLRAALLFGVLGLLVVLVAAEVYDGWRLAFIYTLEGCAASAISSAVVGGVLTRLSPALLRLFVGKRKLRVAVRLQAFRTFVEEEVFATRERTGILIFVSSLERRVEVLADSGISRVVPQSEWDGVVETIAQKLTVGEVALGIELAARACGEILRRYGVDVRPDDRNELGNEVRLRTRTDD